MFIRNEKGFTLAEIIVGMGLMSVMGLGFMAMTKNIGASITQIKKDQSQVFSDDTRAVNLVVTCKSHHIVGEILC